jgi:hypothetical protein
LGPEWVRVELVLQQALGLGPEQVLMLEPALAERVVPVVQHHRLTGGVGLVDHH